MNQTPPRIHFKIYGMSCVEEVVILKRDVGRLVGGEENLSFDLLNGKMTVTLGVADIQPDEILQVVARTGMQAELWQDDLHANRPEQFWQRHGRTILTTASGVLSLTAFLVHWWRAGGLQAALGSEGAGVSHQVPMVAKTLYAAAIVAGAWYVLPRAFRAVRRLRPDMNLLMAIAVLGAIGIGEWLEAATVSFLFAVSLALESWSVGRARRAIAALMDLAPPSARLLRDDGSEEDVPPDAVPIGALFVVKPGERFPLDGRVRQGASEVNQAPITGESVPVPKSFGSEVFAGTINGDGALVIESTKASTETTLAHIVKLVAEAQSRRAPSEQWVERFARTYTPAIMGLAVAVLLIPPLFFGAPWQVWFYRSLVFLVIGCPCALVISTPVSIVAGLAASARNGVLVKGGVHLESPARLRAIALDKTGTLTQGKPAVVDVVAFAQHSQREVLEIAAALEARSDHPLARAILTLAEAEGISAAPAEDLQTVQGKGATARLNGTPYWVGSHRYLEERGQETPEVHRQLEALAQSGRTVVVVGNDAHVCGFIALADAVRAEAKPALEALRALGIVHLVMLTGDSHGTAQAIAGAVGIDDVRAELLPADKVHVVETLVARYGQVAMVGDGVNDAPAMARATIGIAMGAAGSDAAIETADIALMSDDLLKLPWLVRHSRRTLAVIRQNIAFSLGIKVLFVVLTFVGYASLWGAIAADMGASLLVLANGLRLLKTRPFD